MVWKSAKSKCLPPDWLLHCFGYFFFLINDIVVIKWSQLLLLLVTRQEGRQAIKLPELITSELELHCQIGCCCCSSGTLKDRWAKAAKTKKKFGRQTFLLGIALSSTKIWARRRRRKVAPSKSFPQQQQQQNQAMTLVHCINTVALPLPHLNITKSARYKQAHTHTLWHHHHHHQSSSSNGPLQC